MLPAPHGLADYLAGVAFFMAAGLPGAKHPSRLGSVIWFLVRAGEGRKAWGCPFGGILERRTGCVSRSPVFNGEGPAVGLKLPAAQEVLREPRTRIRMPKAASRLSRGLGLPQVSGTELPGKWMLSSTSCISGQNYALWCIFK